MSETQVIEIVNRALYLIVKVSAPMLLVSLIVGLVISILQTVTSIQEQTLTFVPKLLGIFVTRKENVYIFENHRCLHGHISPGQR